MNGVPFPLGPTKKAGGFNFAIYSEVPITAICIAPFSNPTEKVTITLDPKIHATGSIWHFFYPTTEKALYYAYEVNGKTGLMLDPYAPLIHGGKTFGNNNWGKELREPLGLAFGDSQFDWEGDTSPKIASENLVIYEMHLRGFTKHPSSNVQNKGTFSGLVEKIPYLKDLGVNAVEFLPLVEFDENDNFRINPITHGKLCNYWGYAPLSFFAPMQRYSCHDNPLEMLHELKEMVKALHKAGIEVIVDMVFNHTGEGNEYGPNYSWKAFHDNTYYIKDPNGHYYNFSGCGNTFNCNHPISSDLIVNALRFWVTELHIDGIRFDLASILTRGQKGDVLPSSPLIERITQDPILSHCKLIAEPWDAAGLHQVGNFYQKTVEGQKVWIEWNDDYRTILRRFIKGTPGYSGLFATKICGSEDLYGKDGGPLNSLNYITCHDGFTMRDLVSYNDKHNIENGEDNRDGMNNNDSWNMGVEGITLDSAITSLRERQIKNFCLALFISAGVPMLHMGDEYGHTKQGNNNSWCQDSELNWFLWNELERSETLYRFFKKMINFRKNSPHLCRKTFYKRGEIEWHGERPDQPNWSPDSRFVACTIGNLYIAFNASSSPITVELPGTSDWTLVVNTANPSPEDFITHEADHLYREITIEPYSAILLQQ